MRIGTIAVTVVAAAMWLGGCASAPSGPPPPRVWVPGYYVYGPYAHYWVDGYWRYP